MRWRRITAGCSLFAALAVLPPSGSADLLAQQGGAVLREVMRDPLAILSDRSPGKRLAGALVQSKPHLATGPTERVLSPVLERPAAIPADLDNLAQRAQELVDPGLVRDPAAPGSNIAPPTPGSALPGDPGGPVPPLPGGGGGGPPTPPEPTPTPTPTSPPIVTPVPEPATWVMMIAGIGLIGMQLRRRRTAETGSAV